MQFLRNLKSPVVLLDTLVAEMSSLFASNILSCYERSRPFLGFLDLAELSLSAA